jgi:hypothetical protein
MLERELDGDCDVAVISDAVNCLGAVASDGKALCRVAATPALPAEVRARALDAVARGPCALSDPPSVVALYLASPATALSRHAAYALAAHARALPEPVCQALLEQVCNVLRSNNKTPAEERRASLALGAALCAEHDGLSLSPAQAVLVCLATSIELDVGLARVASALLEAEDADVFLPATIAGYQDAARLLDFALTRARLDLYSDEDALAVLSSTDRALAASCAFASRVAKPIDPRAAVLGSLAMSVCAASLTVYWQDDPHSGSGLKLAAERCGFAKVVPACVQTAGPALCFLLPIVFACELCDKLLGEQGSGLRLVLGEWTACAARGEDALAFFAGRVVVAALDTLGGGSPALALLPWLQQVERPRVAAAIAASDRRPSLDWMCARGVVLAFELLIGAVQDGRVRSAMVQDLVTATSPNNQRPDELGEHDDEEWAQVPPSRCTVADARWVLEILKTF